MYFGFAISIVGHALLLLWAYGLMQSTPQLAVPDEQPIEVALVDPSELLRLKKGSLSATELEAKAKDTPKPETSVKEADKPKPVTGDVAPPPPPPSEPDPIAEKLKEPPPPEPAPQPTPDDQQKLADLAAKAEAERQAEERRKAEEQKKKLEEKKKAEERKKRMEERRKAELKKKEDEKNKKSLEQKMAELADKALLDKDPTKKGAPNSATPPTKATDYTGPTAGANQGNDTVLSARDADLLASQIRAQLRQCWSLPAGGGGVELPTVMLTWRMRNDGSLDGEPQVLNPQGDTAYQVAMEAAVRAVKKCSPFRLPPDKYQFWSLIEEWRFIPSEM